MTADGAFFGAPTCCAISVALLANTVAAMRLVIRIRIRFPDGADKPRATNYQRLTITTRFLLIIPRGRGAGTCAPAAAATRGSGSRNGKRDQLGRTALGPADAEHDELTPV